MSDNHKASYTQASQKEKLYLKNLSLEESCEVSSSGNNLERENWSNKAEYLLALVGNAVGIGNIWRFPFQCKMHGGGAFLIPYFLILFMIGYPLLLMEIGLGQKFQCGSVAMWGKLSPHAAGIGVCSLITAICLASYYMVVVSWSFVYAANSIRSPLPWQYCPNTTSDECLKSSPSEYFWFRETLSLPDTISDSTGVFNWQTCVSLTCCTLLVFLGLQKGVKSTGKCMYFGVLLPYAILGIFFVRALTLEGALEGISYLLKVDLSTLKEFSVWQAAITQIFFSIGIGYGAYGAQASYMKRKNNCKFDVIFVATVNSMTSLLATVIVFGILGFRATIKSLDCYEEHASLLNTSIEELQQVTDYTKFGKINPLNCTLEKQLDKASGGPGLAFITFAEAIVNLPFSNVWSLMFFVMLGSIGLSSLVGVFTGIVASGRDLGVKLSKMRLAFLLCIGMLSLAIPYTLDIGYYLIDILDSNVGSLTLCTVGLLEVVFTSYVYGIDRFLRDVKEMTGVSSGRYWKYTLKYVCPVILSSFFVANLIRYCIHSPLTYTAWNSSTGSQAPMPYPTWAYFMFIFISLFCLGSIPLVALLVSLGKFDLFNYISRQNTKYPSKDIEVYA